ncbi:MAG: hypothetical protein ABSH28_18430 [Acidobacteriota bacterium]
MRPFSRPWHGWLLVAACLAAAWLIRTAQDQIDARQNRSLVDPDVLYFSSPRAVKALALGYDGLIADVYWMRAIQYYGRRDEAARRQVRYKNLPALLDIVTTLDPRMLDVYRAGSIFLAEPEPLGAGEPLEALRLLYKGVSLRPLEWPLRFDQGFVYYLYLKDYRRAGQAWLEASRVEGAPPWMEGLAAHGLSQGGDVETARYLWRRQLEGSARADVRDEDLVRAGFLDHVPLDPSGVPYQYNSATGAVTLSSASRVRYLEMPDNYRKTIKDNLARTFTAKTSRHQ